MTEWLDIDGLARYLSMPKSTLYKLQQRGALPSHRLGRKLLFDRAEVDAAIKANATRPASKAEKRHARKSKAS